MNRSVAQAILKDLGGSKFEAMVNPKDYVTRGFDLQFKFPKSKVNKSNMIKIEINSKDLYNVTFYSMNARKFELNKIETINDVFACDLKRVFTSKTGYEVEL